MSHQHVSRGHCRQLGWRGVLSVMGVLPCVAAVAACSERTSAPPLPTVASVSPTSGPLAGGTGVTITGANFPATIDSVRFGSGRLANLMQVSATQLTGMTPAASAAGAVDLTVYTCSAGNGSLGWLTWG